MPMYIHRLAAYQMLKPRNARANRQPACYLGLWWRGWRSPTMKETSLAGSGTGGGCISAAVGGVVPTRCMAAARREARQGGSGSGFMLNESLKYTWRRGVAQAQ